MKFNCPFKLTYDVCFYYIFNSLLINLDNSLFYTTLFLKELSKKQASLKILQTHTS